MIDLVLWSDGASDSSECLSRGVSSRCGSAMMNLTVQVPAGAPPGALVQFTAPNGQPVQAQIPQGLGPGAQFTIAALPPAW